MKEIRKVISDISLFLFVFFVIPIVGFILVTSRTNVFFGIRSYVVQTGSMKPVLPIGSMVFTKPQENYEVGEVITFRRGDISVTHRILNIKDSKYQTKGDANNAADPQLVDKKDVVGADFLVIPYLGLITNFVKTPLGFLLVIVLPNIVFIGFEIWNMKEEYRRHIERKILKEIKEII